MRNSHRWALRGESGVAQSALLGHAARAPSLAGKEKPTYKDTKAGGKENPYWNTLSTATSQTTLIPPQNLPAARCLLLVLYPQ